MYTLWMKIQKSKFILLTVFLRQPITGVEWNYVFMSSILRSFVPQNQVAMRIVPEL